MVAKGVWRCDVGVYLNWVVLGVFGLLLVGMIFVPYLFVVLILLFYLVFGLVLTLLCSWLFFE